MRKEEILKELALHQDTVLSFPNRGPWGDSHYRGIAPAGFRHTSSTSMT